MLAALADGRSTIRGYLAGADCLSTLACLQSLGVAIRRTARGDVEIEGRGLRGLTAALGPLDAGNSGTTMRLLSGIVAAHEFRTVMGGDASLSRRPMKRVIRPLTEMGAAIGSEDGRPPLTIDGGRLRGITHRPEVPSAQIKSAVLLAGLQAEGETTRARARCDARSHRARVSRVRRARAEDRRGHQRHRRTAPRRA